MSDIKLYNLEVERCIADNEYFIECKEAELMFHIILDDDEWCLEVLKETEMETEWDAEDQDEEDTLEVPIIEKEFTAFIDAFNLIGDICEDLLFIVMK